MTGDEWSAGPAASMQDLATRLATRDLATRDLDDRAPCATNPGNYT